MNETAARAWIKSIGNVILEGTSITNTTVDDAVVKMFFDAIDNDILWGLLWPLIDDIFAESVLVKASPELCAESEKAGIDPMTILAIITAIFNLWKQFRK